MADVKLSMRFLKEMKKDHRRFISKLIAENGPNFAVRSPFVNLHFLSDPGFLQHILVDNDSNYYRPSNKIIDGIVSRNGRFDFKNLQQWSNERSDSINEWMSEKSIQAYADILIKTTANHLDQWDKNIQSQAPLAIRSAVMAVALQNLSQALFGKITLDPDRLTRRLQEFFYLMACYESSATKLAWKLPTAMRAKTRNFMRDMRNIIDEITEFCLSEQASDDNVVKHIAKHYCPDFPNLSSVDKNYLAERVGIFLIGGFENVATTVSWVLIYLSRYPLLAEKLRLEIKNIIGSDTLKSSHINSLKMIQASILETLRLTCGSFIPRAAMSKDQIGNYVINKNDRILFPVFYLHREPQYWENPEGFMPERFLKPLTSRYRFVYLPFSTGPHGCIGNHFAMLEMTIILATILQRYQLCLAPNQFVDPDFQYQDPDQPQIMMTVHQLP